MRLITLTLLLVALWTGNRAAAADDALAPAAAAVQNVLPDYEKAADECFKSLAALDLKGNANAALAADGAQLCIEVTRSVRAILDTDPKFMMHVSVKLLDQWKEGMAYFLDCAKAGKDPFDGMTSGLRTVRSPIDGQLLFYKFKLPPGYDKNKRYPLRVDLHAGAGLVWRATWISGKPSSTPRQANNEDAIWISPDGRGNQSYAAMGEAAVFDAIADVKKHYSVDEDRLTIGGASMGGTGGFRLGTLRPDLFAAAHSLTGGAFYGVPQNNGRYDATLLVDNLCDTALCIWDATKEGHYPANHAFAAALADLQKAHSGYYPFLEVTDPNGSHGIIDKKMVADGWDWVRQQKRNPNPKLVIFKTYCLRYDGAYWVTIDTVIDPAAPARIEAQVTDDGKIRVVTQNVERFHLDMRKELFGDAKVVPMTIDLARPLGTDILAPEMIQVQKETDVITGGPVYFEKQGQAWSHPKGRNLDGVKHHGVSGPIADAFMESPVLMVVGTLTPALQRPADWADTMVDSAVLRLWGKGDGGAVLHARFERKNDQHVSEQDLRDKNLVLFGTPAQNALVKKIADRLPVKFLDDGVALGGKEYRGQGVVLAMIYPNPLNPERYILLLPENYGSLIGHGPGTTLGFPDYIVGQPREGYGGLQWTILTKGTFDSRWQLPTR